MGVYSEGISHIRVLPRFLVRLTADMDSQPSRQRIMELKEAFSSLDKGGNETIATKNLGAVLTESLRSEPE